MAIECCTSTQRVLLRISIDCSHLLADNVTHSADSIDTGDAQYLMCSNVDSKVKPIAVTTETNKFKGLLSDIDRSQSKHNSNQQTEAAVFVHPENKVDDSEHDECTRHQVTPVILIYYIFIR